MKHVVILNTQALGDCLLGTHTAKQIRQHYKDVFITFATRANLVPTTGESDLNDGVALRLLSMQEGIDAVGFVTADGQIHTNIEIPKTIDLVVNQDAWFSDLGIAASQHFDWNKKMPDFQIEDTETEFNVGTGKELPNDRLVISISGPLDWNRKTKNEVQRLNVLTAVQQYLQNNKVQATIQLLGRDVEREDLIVSLQRLNNSHLYIGPMGLPVHAAAGLSVDTIHICSVFPSEYDSPQKYHSGWHRPIISKIHCGTYSCVSEKLSSTQVYPEGPTAAFGFWPKICPHTENKMSCIYNVTAEQVVEQFDAWYKEKGQFLWSH